MAKRYFIQDYTLSAIANKIREHGGMEGRPMNVVDMPKYIETTTPSIGLIDGTISSITNNSPTVRDYCFFGCANLNYASFSLCSYVGKSAFRNTPVTELYLPNCTSYGQSAFNGCSQISKLTIGVPYISIATAAEDLYTILSGNTNLEEVHLTNCDYIASSVFQGCVNLKTVEAPVLNSVWNKAFYGCTSLESISFPNLTYVGTNAFYNCKSLTTVYLPEVSSINTNAFYATAIKELYAPKFTTISATPFGTIGSTASGGVMTFESVTIGFSTVPNLFQKQANLTYVSASNATSIAANAFLNCTALSEEGWYFGSTGLTTIGASAFQGCTSIRVIDNEHFKGGETCVVGSTAFYGCTGLERVNTSAFTTIQSRTFGNCTALSEVYLPNVTTITIASAAAATGPFVSCTNLHTLSLPALTSIPAYGFYALSTLSSLYIPKCTHISQHGISQCAALTRLDGPEVVNLGHYNLQGTNISQVYLPKVSYVGKYGFSNAVLESIYAPLWSTAHASGVFSAAAKTTLKYLNMGYVTAPVYSAYVGLRSFINESCTTLARYAFYGCTSLYTVSLPNCATVASQAFQGCTALPSITLPAATKISNSAFLNCTNFSYLKVGTSNCALGTNALSSTGITATTGSIMVPADYVDTYKAAANWSAFADRIFGY